MQEVNNEPIDVSIIIPAYNSGAVIGKCLESIIDQDTDVQIEIIVIDDGSSDNTSSIVKSKLCNYKFYTLVHAEKNGGVSAARNLGMGLSRGKYITFIDADDYIDRGYIRKLLDAAELGFDIVVSEAIDIKADGSIVGGKITSENKVLKFDDSYRFDSPYSHLTSWGCLFSKSAVEKIRFDESIVVGEDTLFFYNVLASGSPALHIPFMGYYYVQNETSAIHSKDYNRYADEVKAWTKIYHLIDKSQNLSSRVMYIIMRRALNGLLKCKTATQEERCFFREAIKKSFVPSLRINLIDRRFARIPLVFAARILAAV